MSNKLSQLEMLVEPIAESFGCELWGLEYHANGKHSVVRIYIERDPGGVSVDDCEKVSRQVSSVFDVEDPISGEYALEVSSPGMDRPLYKLEHYTRFVGAKMAIKLRISFEGRKKFTGLCKGVESDEIVLEVDNEEYLLPFELIDKANVVPTF